MIFRKPVPRKIEGWIHTVGLFLLLGLITIYLRIFKNSKGLGKLETMKETYGEKLGLAIHIISYTVVPIAVGIVMIVRYFL